MLNLYYYKQRQDYTCGPVCLQMVFRYFGKFILRKKLIYLCRTTKKYGTSHAALIGAVKSLGFFTYIHKNCNLKHLQHYINLNLPIIINYIEPSDNFGHYSVVIGFDKEDIILNDPWNGYKFRIDKDFFIKRWHNTHGSNKWMLVVSNEKLYSN